MSTNLSNSIATFSPRLTISFILAIWCWDKKCSCLNNDIGFLNSLNWNKTSECKVCLETSFSKSLYHWWSEFEFAKLRAMRACVPTWSTCQRGLRANVPMCQKRTYVPKACHLLIFTCQCANVWASLPNDVRTCQKTCQFSKHFSYEMLREISIFYFWIKNPALYLISYLYICVYVSHIEIVLYFISVLHAILKKSVWNFCFLKLFCSLVFCFYTLQTTSVFSNFPLKQLKPNKEHVWILWSFWIDLLEFEIRDSYKETLL